jgi:hypothetical protein
MDIKFSLVPNYTLNSPKIFFSFTTPGEDWDAGFGQSSGHLVLGRVDVACGPVNLEIKISVPSFITELIQQMHSTFVITGLCFKLIVQHN